MTEGRATFPVEPWALTEPWWPAEIIADLCDSWEGGDSLYRRVTQDVGTPLLSAVRPEDAGLGSVVVADRVFQPTPRASWGSREQWTAYSPLDYWRNPETLETRRVNGGVQIACEREALEVVVESGRATGVRVRGEARSQTVSAGAVVLCAGTIDSGRLAIDALRKADPRTVPALSGLTDHLVQQFSMTVDASRALDCPLRPGTFTAVGDGSCRSNYFLGVNALGDGHLKIDVRAMGEQLPWPENCLERVSAADESWSVRAAYTMQDRAILRAQRSALNDIHRSLCAIFNLPYERMAADIGPLGTIQHEGGLLRIGDLLGADHQFNSVPGLYAGGPATFPRMGAANPTLTTLALARRLGGILDLAHPPFTS